MGHSTTLDQWDVDDNLPNKKHPNYKNLKLLIQKKQIEADKVIIELDEKGEQYTVNDIIDRLRPRSFNITVFQYTEDLIKRLRKANKVGNANVYQTALSTFKNYRKDVDLTFHQFT